MNDKPRLIDANMIDVVSYADKAGDFGEGVNFMLDKIDAAPTIDAVEVVRCGDCKHATYATSMRGELLPGSLWCMRRVEMQYPDWFCSCGERREASHD